MPFVTHSNLHRCRARFPCYGAGRLCYTDNSRDENIACSEPGPRLAKGGVRGYMLTCLLSRRDAAAARTGERLDGVRHLSWRNEEDVVILAGPGRVVTGKPFVSSCFQELRKVKRQA